MSQRTQRSLDKLARERPDLKAKVAAGELSCHRACVEAGFVKVRSPLQQAVALLGRLSDDELGELIRAASARRKGGRS